MKKLTYQAVFEPTPQGGYSVYFPDLSGCITVGKTLPEAQSQAIDALSTHLHGMEQLGLEIPPPSLHPKANPETEIGYSIHPVTIFPDLTLLDHLELPLPSP